MKRFPVMDVEMGQNAAMEKPEFAKHIDALRTILSDTDAWNSRSGAGGALEHLNALEAALAPPPLDLDKAIATDLHAVIGYYAQRLGLPLSWSRMALLQRIGETAERLRPEDVADLVGRLEGLKAVLGDRMDIGESVAECVQRLVNQLDGKP